MRRSLERRSLRAAPAAPLLEQLDLRRAASRVARAPPAIVVAVDAHGLDLSVIRSTTVPQTRAQRTARTSDRGPPRPASASSLPAASAPRTARASPRASSPLPAGRAPTPFARLRARPRPSRATSLPPRAAAGIRLQRRRRFQLRRTLTEPRFLFREPRRALEQCLPPRLPRASNSSSCTSAHAVARAAPVQTAAAPALRVAPRSSARSRSSRLRRARARSPRCRQRAARPAVLLSAHARAAHRPIAAPSAPRVTRRFAPRALPCLPACVRRRRAPSLGELRQTPHRGPACPARAPRSRPAARGASRTSSLRAAQSLVAEHARQKTRAISRPEGGHDIEFFLPGEVRVEELRRASSPAGAATTP